MKLAHCNICGCKIEINNKNSIHRYHTCEKHKGLKILKCKNCKKEFIGTKNTRFCSNKCKTFFKIKGTLIKYFNLDINKLFEDEINRIKNELIDLYWNKHLSSTQICKQYNYPNVGNLTGKIFKYFDIPSKTCKECIKENYLYGRLKSSTSNTIYKQQWHTTWNEKEVYLHSSYELDYAKELDKQKIDYEVEYFHIKYWDSQKQEYRCAIPDFYIPKDNMIVEIKSSWTLDEQNMKDKMKAYKELGYNTKLICDHKEINIY